MYRLTQWTEKGYTEKRIIYNPVFFLSRTVTFCNGQRLKSQDGTEKRILDGETEYFSVFLDRYSRPLYTLVVQIVGCPEDAEELLQDIFLKTFRNLNRYKGECRFSTWIYRIAYNTAISATRKKKQEFLYIEENTINNVPDEMADNVLAPAETEEQLVRLGMAIDQLSGEEKALITLFYYEEKSMEEIGEVLKLSISNVKVRLHRTRKKICVLMNNK